MPHNLYCRIMRRITDGLNLRYHKRYDHRHGNLAILEDTHGTGLKESRPICLPVFVF
jgi:hypothetical protein